MSLVTCMEMMIMVVEVSKGDVVNKFSFRIDDGCSYSHILCEIFYIIPLFFYNNFHNLFFLTSYTCV